MSYPDYVAADFSPPRELRSSTTTTLSRSLGYIGLLAWLLPIVGLPITTLGLVLGVVALWGPEPSKALRAVLICILGLVLSLGNALAGIYLAMNGYNYSSFSKKPAAVAKQPLEIVNPHCEPQAAAPTTSP